MPRFAIMPMVLVEVAESDPLRYERRAKHHDIGEPYAIVDFGDTGQDFCLFYGEFSNDAIAVMQADTETFVLPVNLGNAVAGSRNAVRQRLEAINVPSGWVASTTTYREIAQRLVSIALFMQRVSGLSGSSVRLFTGRTLGTQLSDVPLAYRQAAQQAAASFGVDTQSLTGTSTVRDLLALINFDVRSYLSI